MDNVLRVYSLIILAIPIPLHTTLGHVVCSDFATLILNAVDDLGTGIQYFYKLSRHPHWINDFEGIAKSVVHSKPLPKKNFTISNSSCNDNPLKVSLAPVHPLSTDPFFPPLLPTQLDLAVCFLIQLSSLVLDSGIQLNTFRSDDV